MNIQHQIKSVKNKIEKLRFQLAVEEKVLTRLKAIEEPIQHKDQSESNNQPVSYGSITGQLKQIMQESDRPMTVKELKKALIERGVKSNAKQGLGVAISSALFKRKDTFRRLDRGLYEIKRAKTGDGIISE